MNVNIWGPPFWEILHGMAGLVNARNYTSFQFIMFHLNYLLPCIHCRNSYIEFYKLLDFTTQANNKYYMLQIYNLHNMVNKKLDDQKKRLNMNPSFDIILKRFYLSMNLPFCDEQLWKIIYILALNNKIDTQVYLVDFLRNMGLFFASTDYYKEESALLLNLSSKLAKLDYTVPEKLFEYIQLERYGKIDAQIFKLYSDIVPANSCATYTCK